MAIEKHRLFQDRSRGMVPDLEKYGPTFVDLKNAGFDPEALWQRVEGDVELLRDIVSIFERETPSMLQRIGAAVDERDAAALQRSGHKLKGSLLQFSAGAAAATALKIEELGKRGSVDGGKEFLQTLTQQVDLLLQSLHAMAQRMAGHCA